jgi:prepilin-type N-terminal cleavage/methylation domain-containing protein
MLKKAFTLIELLVVIAIIAILASMLVPGLGRAEEATKYTTCLGNMKQIGLGLVWYTNEWGDWMPVNSSSNAIFCSGMDPATAEAYWDSLPSRQSQMFGIKPPSAGPGCWPPYAPTLAAAAHKGVWCDKVYKYISAQEVGACPNGMGTWKDCSDCSGFLCNLGVWGLVGHIGPMEWNYGYNEDMSFDYWKDGDWGFGNGRNNYAGNEVNMSEMTHAGDTIFSSHRAGDRHAPHVTFAWPVTMHPVYGHTNKHFRSTGPVYNLRSVANGGEWPSQDNRILDGVVGKSPYLMADSSVRGYDLKPLAWDATRLCLGTRAADNLEHSWPP